MPLQASKRDQIGSILSSCRDPGEEPGLVFSLLCLDSRVLCMCQVTLQSVLAILYDISGQKYPKISSYRHSAPAESSKKSTKSERFRSLAPNLSS